MSLEVICKTSIKDRDALVSTIEDIIGQKVVSVVDGGIDVTGYYSKRRPEVIISIPGLIGTAGYYKNADGNYELVYDSTDGRRLSKLIPKKKGAKIIDLVAQTYAKHKVIKMTTKKLRGRIVSNNVLQDGTIKIKTKITHY